MINVVLYAANISDERLFFSEIADRNDWNIFRENDVKLGLIQEI